ncbi:hypothetical protein NQZ68_032620 [Dissostichus eleginoides]|nr:hypothetical protein NQZ68_032620 [Dissostichus eleginoides]
MYTYSLGCSSSVIKLLDTKAFDIGAAQSITEQGACGGLATSLTKIVEWRMLERSQQRPNKKQLHPADFNRKYRKCRKCRKCRKWGTTEMSKSMFGEPPQAETFVHWPQKDSEV